MDSLRRMRLDDRNMLFYSASPRSKQPSTSRQPPASSASGQNWNNVNDQSSFDSILEEITAKYGDIAKGCSLKSAFSRTKVLEGICNIVKVVRSVELAQLDDDQFNDFYLFLEDAQMMGFDVMWLCNRLSTLREALLSSDLAKGFTDEKNELIQRNAQLKKDLQLRKQELRLLEEKIGEMESQLQMETFEVAKLDEKINVMTDRYEYLMMKSSEDGLP